MHETFLLPNANDYEPTKFKIVNCLVPHYAMLGPKHRVTWARRMGPGVWEIRYATKRFWQRWPEIPCLNIRMREIESLKHFWFVRQAEVLATGDGIPANFFGPEVRVVAHGTLHEWPSVAAATQVGKFNIKVWYIKNEELDGVDAQPDATCYSPRTGKAFAYRKIPSPDAVAHAKKRYADYQAELEAVAQGKVRYGNRWITLDEQVAIYKYADEQSDWQRRARGN
jgi:hypothetical protein